MIGADPLPVRSLRWFATGLPLVGVGLVVTVHALSDLNPFRHRMSEYVHGSGGSLMVAAFFALGAGVVATGGTIVLDGPRGRGTWAAAGALLAAGIGLMVAGLAPTDPGAATVVETVHSRASGVATLTIIGVALAWSWTSRPRHNGLRRLAATAAVLGALSVILHDTALAGLGQRLLWIALVVWLLLVGRPWRRQPSRCHRGGQDSQND